MQSKGTKGLVKQGKYTEGKSTKGKQMFVKNTPSVALLKKRNM